MRIFSANAVHLTSGSAARDGRDRPIERGRVVELFAHGPQVQERLTKQIADWLDDQLKPSGVGVVIEAEHLCMTLRGVLAAGARTLTSTLLGVLRDDPRSRAEFLALVGK